MSLPKINPTHTAAWSTLSQQYQQQKDLALQDLFLQEPGRIQEFSAQAGAFYLDYSKNLV